MFYTFVLVLNLTISCHLWDIQMLDNWYWLDFLRRNSLEPQFSGDAPSPASFAETAEPWKKAQWWHTSLIFEVLYIQDGFWEKKWWNNGGFLGCFGMFDLVHTPASEVTEALKDIEWLTMPLIDKRLAGELGELGERVFVKSLEITRFLCNKKNQYLKLCTFSLVYQRFRQAETKVDKPHQEFPFCMTHLEPKHLWHGRERLKGSVWEGLWRMSRAQVLSLHSLTQALSKGTFELLGISARRFSL